MSRPIETRAVLRTFLASPGDVAVERELASKIIEELNLIWSRFLGLMLELVRWETHTYPGVDIDPQALINRQIADEYEIFIGVMWSRFGTPTNRAGSGTEEEFERAYARYQADPQSVRIMFYFKSAPPPPAADPVQLSQVLQFRQRIGKEALYFMYEDDQNFTSLLRLHLSRQMQDFQRVRLNSALRSKTLHPKRLGRTLPLLKLAPVHFVEGFRALVQLRALGLQWSRFGTLFRQFGSDVKRIDVKAADARGQLDSVARLTASSLVQLVAQTRPLLSSFDRSFQIYMDSISKMAPLFVGWPGHSLTRKLILSQLKRLHSGIDFGIPGYVDMQASLSDLAVLPAFQEAAAVGPAFFADVLATWTRALQLVIEAERTYSNF